MTIIDLNAFTGPPPEEVALDPNPLVRVLAQVRFPPILMLEREETVAPIQDVLRRRFPMMERLSGSNVEVSLDNGVPSVRQKDQRTLWQFATSDRLSSVTISQDTVTLDTQTYQSRSEFLDLMVEVLEIVGDKVQPAFAASVSMRYVNRLDAAFVEDHVDRMPEYARGFMRKEWSEMIDHSITETHLRVAEGAMIIRAGVLPPHTTFDVNIVQPTDRRSWILDLDLGAAGQHPFETRELRALFASIAGRSYAVFRNAIGNAVVDAVGVMS